MESVDLCYMPATEMATAIRRKQLSPVEVIDAVLARIDQVNPCINAYCTVVPELARQAAREAETTVMRGGELGFLHGVPISFKDLTPTAGVRTTSGSKIFEHFIPEEDALVVQRAKKAGAILMGKTNTPEFGCKAVTDNRIFGATRNPWNPERIAGGSSGGAAAAIATGMGPLGEGSDLAGSIRVPASCCGIVGLKPSLGRVPRYPSVNGWTTFSVIGPMARTVRDVALLFQVMAGPDDRDPQSLPNTGEDFVTATEKEIRGTRLAWSVDLGYAPIDPLVRQITTAAVKRFVDLGCQVEEANPGFENPDHLFRALTAPMRAANLSGYLDQWRDQMDPILLQRIGQAEGMTAIVYERLTQKRTELWQIVRRFFARYDLLVTPTVAVPPFAIGINYPTEIDGQKVDSPLSWIPFTFPFNLTGQPAISIPCGWTDEGLPVGLQIVGRRFADAMVLRAAAAFERVAPWANTRPMLK